MPSTTFLDNDQIRRAAPSVFGTQAADRMSNRYRQIPTIEVVDMLRDRGYLPVQVKQTRARTEGRSAVARHLLRFRHADYLGGGRLAVGDEIPELVLSNSHDGTAAYRFMCGIFRLVCENGMIVQSADFGSVQVKHIGDKDFASQIIDATFRVADEAPKVMQKIDTWKQLALPAPARLAYAAAAAELKPTAGLNPNDLLRPQRLADVGTDLWTTSNVVQEHVMKGGDRGRATSGRRTTTRPVKAVAEDIRLNRALWVLSEKMAEMMGA